MRVAKIVLALSVSVAGSSGAPLWGSDSNGTIRGVVTLERDARPVHNVHIILAPPGRVTETDDDGVFEFRDLPPGTYDLVATLANLSAETLTVELASGATVSVEITLRLSPIRQEITVTASGREQTAFDAFQSVTALDSFDLAQRGSTGLGDVLEFKSGIGKRSFGPGTTRPIIRGFDGDRVLVLQDGIRTGSLASQSGDHGEPIDVLTLERLEVVKGPATLLYGSNALGGVVNAVSGKHHIHAHPHEGVRGHITGLAGSTNALGGGGASIEVGTHHWLFWGNASGQRTGDYNTPVGRIENSETRTGSVGAGLGWFGDRTFASFGYNLGTGRYGVPFAQEFHAHDDDDHDEGENDHDEEELEAVDLEFRRHAARLSAGIRGLGPAFDGFRFSLNYTAWKHEEIEHLHDRAPEVATTFNNRQFVYRGVFDQKQAGNLSGSFGFWGMARRYRVHGEEALAPPVDQSGFALFGLEELRFERFRLQFGGRVEHTRYNPLGPRPVSGDDDELDDRDGELLPRRTFTGFSGAAGIHVPLWKGGFFVTNYTHSHRAPALEELYNLGPHVGNLTFEIGNPDLRREVSNGMDVSLRHLGQQVRAEANLFYYNIDNFVFLAPTGDVEDGLIEAEFLQGDSRFVGTELDLDFGVHPNLWLLLGLDVVNARLTEVDSPLPRIPPVRGRIGLDLRHNGFSLNPELILVRSQENLFATETRTPGYGVVNLRASYTIPQQHFAHHFSVSAFNMGDRIYRNHLSFIKDLAPEMGRGIRASYTVKFF